MLVQVRDGETWLIRQHDHGLLAGELALRWGTRELDRPEPHHLIVLAVSLHDVGWIEVDEQPLLNPQTHVPHNVFDYPMEPRAAFFAHGLDQAEHVHPYVGLLDSLHYSTFPIMRDNAAFQGGEARRQRRVRDLLDFERSTTRGDLDATAAAHLEFLRMMDRLSLYLCNTLPGSRRLHLPGYRDSDDAWSAWNGSLEERLFTRAPETPYLRPLDLRWEDERRLSIDPFPFAEPFELTLPVRRLSGTRFENASELRAAWVESERLEIALAIVPREA